MQSKLRHLVDIETVVLRRPIDAVLLVVIGEFLIIEIPLATDMRDRLPWLGVVGAAGGAEQKHYTNAGVPQ